MAKCSVQTTSFGTVVREAEGCIYTNPKDKYQQLIERFMLVLNLFIVWRYGEGGNT